jgi:hypothetical protein
VVTHERADRLLSHAILNTPEIYSPPAILIGIFHALAQGSNPLTTAHAQGRGLLASHKIGSRWLSFFPARSPLGLALASALALAPHMTWAQAAIPFGFWSTDRGEETFYIGQNGCQFEAFNAQRQPARLVSGECSWNSSSGGGILTIMANQLYRPAPIYFNIVWINQNAISVSGDIFHRLTN